MSKSFNMLSAAAETLSIFNAFHILIKPFIVALVKSPPQYSAAIAQLRRCLRRKWFYQTTTRDIKADLSEGGFVAQFLLILNNERHLFVNILRPLARIPRQ